MRRFLRLTLLATSLVVLLVTVPYIIHGIRVAGNPLSKDVADAIFEYYADLRARLASGDRAALDELATRLKHGPLQPIAESTARAAIQGLPPPEEITESEAGDWVRKNKDRLSFDPQLGMFRLLEETTTRPANAKVP
jgi:hypothetical protein